MKNLSVNLLVLFFVSVGLAETETPAPIAKVYEELTEQLQSQSWQVYQVKLVQLLESYAPRVSPDEMTLGYWSDDSSNCPNGFRGEYKYRITHKVIQEDNQLTQIIHHESCGQRAFTEVLSLKGKDLAPMNSLEVFTGVRKTVLKENETERKYELRSLYNERLFAQIDQRQGDIRRMTYFLGETPTAQAILKEAEGKLFLRFRGASGNWKISNTGNIGLDFNADSQLYTVIENKLDLLTYYDHKNRKELAVNDYKTILSGFPFALINFGLGNFFKYFTQLYAPASAFVSAGSANDRLTEEIRKLVDNLRLGIDTEFVISELVKLIEAVEAGQIEDRREQ